VSEHLEGRVVQVLVQEGSAVRRGELLLQFDTRRLDHEMAKVRRRLEGARAELEKLDQLAELQQSQYGIAQAKAAAELEQATAEIATARQTQELDIRQAQIKLALANDHYARCEKLAASRSISLGEVAAAKANVRTAEEELNQARMPLNEERLAVLRHAITLVQRDYAVRTAELDAKRIAKRQELDTAAKELADLERQAELAALRSPVDGVITKGQFHVGDVVSPGSVVFEIAPHGGYCFESMVPSEDIGLVRDRMPARVKLDAYDYQLYGSVAGAVCFISPDAAQHEQAATMRTLSYRVRTTVPSDRLGQGEFSGDVKLGMTGQVEIITGQRTVLAILIKRIRSSISFG
jgi:multidrug resistance efflux pump